MYQGVERAFIGVCSVVSMVVSRQSLTLDVGASIPIIRATSSGPRFGKSGGIWAPIIGGGAFCPRSHHMPKRDG